MGKFYGVIGFAGTTETSPGVWTEAIKERNYSGEIIKNTKRWESSEHLNDNLTLNNQFSIIADPYENLYTIRYIKWMGVKWKVTGIDMSNHPRLILTIGGVYNGDTTTTPNTP